MAQFSYFILFHFEWPENMPYFDERKEETGYKNERQSKHIETIEGKFLYCY